MHAHSSKLKKRSDSIGMRCASLLGNVNMVFGGRTKESSDLKSSAERNRKLVREKNPHRIYFTPSLPNELVKYQMTVT